MDLIISRYQEDITWTNSLPSFINTICYNKFFDSENKLPNVGREGHTYLYHIINKYDNLSEINAFCQGNPIDHKPDILNVLSNIDTIRDNIQASGFYPLGLTVTEGPYANIHTRHRCGLPMFYVLNMFFDLGMSISDKYDTVYGGQFIVHKNNILARPKQFYVFLYKILSYEVDPIEGYILERLWPYIFNKELQLSPKILYFICQM